MIFCYLCKELRPDECFSDKRRRLLLELGEGHSEIYCLSHSTSSSHAASYVINGVVEKPPIVYGPEHDTSEEDSQISSSEDDEEESTNAEEESSDDEEEEEGDPNAATYEAWGHPWPRIYEHLATKYANYTKRQMLDKLERNDCPTGHIRHLTREDAFYEFIRELMIAKWDAHNATVRDVYIPDVDHDEEDDSSISDADGSESLISDGWNSDDYRPKPLAPQRRLVVDSDSSSDEEEESSSSGGEDEDFFTTEALPEEIPIVCAAGIYTHSRSIIGKHIERL